VIERVDVVCVIENDEDVDNWFRVETGNCGTADVMNFNNSLTEDRLHYRGFFLDSCKLDHSRRLQLRAALELSLSPVMVRWAADGRSVLYNKTRNNVTNIWNQPLDGGPARQLTNFRDSLVYSFEWSPDGKQLAAARGNPIRDAVLINNSR